MDVGPKDETAICERTVREGWRETREEIGERKGRERTEKRERQDREGRETGQRKEIG